MRGEVRYGMAALHRRRVLTLVAWSLPQALPTALSGVAIARATDTGFLAGRPLLGFAWLAVLMATAGIGAVGSRQVYRHLGDLVEPFRDDLVRRVVDGALRRGISGRPDDGAIARLTRQVEVVRDAYAGLIVALLGFVATVVGVVVGLLSLDPVVALLILPPFLLGLAAFVATLGLAADRQLASVRAGERLATTAGSVLSGVRDVVARGAEDHAARMVARPIADQAAAERAMARVSALHALCFAVGGWLPLVVLLIAGPWLVRQGLTAGAIMGALTYVLFGLQPTLRTLIATFGDTGLRFVVTLRRILDTSEPRATLASHAHASLRPSRHDLSLDRVRFAYGPHAQPIVDELDLTVPEGDHLAIVGPSGIGKSTLATLMCGLLHPDAGTIRLGGASVADMSTDELAAARVLIPQEAYVFTGTAWDNLTYLRPTVRRAQVDEAVDAVGADAVLGRIGGYRAELDPSGLSAGEGQLIALARAYVADAPIAVLDEATCHLDPTAERQAEQAFARRGGTLVVIAHRISSALRARRILVLDGTRATVGDHTTLLATSALYQELLGHWQAGPPSPPRQRGGRLESRCLQLHRAQGGEQVFGGETELMPGVGGSEAQHQVPGAGL
jgi:ATP-binding cassette, subfamily C, bacterial